MKSSVIAVQRIYEGTGPEGRYLALVDRMWPRGLRRADLGLDEWARDIAPTPELCKWFSHIDERWDEFRTRYLAELATPEQQARMAALLAAAGTRPPDPAVRRAQHRAQPGHRAARRLAGLRPPPRQARGLKPVPGTGHVPKSRHADR